MNPIPLPPHPQLDRYYSSEAERPGVVSDLFDEGAPHYEWICSVMSFGTGERYRRQALSDAGLGPGMRVLDVATGTGLVLRSATDLTGSSGLAVGLDPSGGMLRECRKNCPSPLLQGRGEHLPLADASFDMVSMGYGLRHVADLRALFAEYSRVLKPGGRLLLLEITQPQSAIGRWLNRLYLSTVVPGIARIGTRAAAASRMMEYFWDTIETCVPPDVILGALKDAGFSNATRRVTGGVLSEYRGEKAR
jgi:demethylmenaquinone methyltransferase/2-methoxy-6-polyprenyl-1,4-benzoquinol methylase